MGGATLVLGQAESTAQNAADQVPLCGAEPEGFRLLAAADVEETGSCVVNLVEVAASVSNVAEQDCSALYRKRF